MNTGDKLGRYELGERIGAGAMSEVFASRHPLLERDVAIKVLKKEVGSDQQYIARFLDDARAAHALNHPNIVRVFDVDDSAAQPFIVMDLVKGQPLDEWRKGQVELAVAVQIMRDVASALAAAHQGGLIHRDVKPSNVLIEKSSGAAKLTDFGAAKRQRDEGQELTQIGQRIGTPRYMAPEQVEGSDVSKCTDLFALGALGYELRAGRPAFEGDSVAAVYHGILSKQPPPLTELRSDLPASLVELIERLLQKKPEDRPASAEEVVAALDQLEHVAPAPETIAAKSPKTSATAAAGAGRPPAAPPAAPKDRPAAGAAPDDRQTGPSGSGLPVVPIAAGVALLLVLLGGYWLFSGGEEPAEPTVAEADGTGPGGDQAEAGPAEAAPEDEPAAPEDEPAAPEDEPAAPEDQLAAPEDQPAADDEAAAADEPPADEPAESPGTDQAPAADQPADEPSLATALREEQAGASPGPADEGPPAAEEPVAEEPVAEEPTPDEPVAEEPTPDEPVAEEPTPDEPVAEEPPAEQAAAAPGAEAGAGDVEAASAAEDAAGGAADAPGELAQVPVAPSPELPAENIPPLNCGPEEPGCMFAETVAATIEPVDGGRPEITLNKEDGVYLDQEYLVAEVAMPPDLGGYLYLDVYTDNGEVFHLLPEPLRESNDLRAGAMIRVGVEEDERATGIRHWQISGPFGTGWLMALVTEKRLFDGLRPIGETIEGYRPVLLDALDDPTVGRTSYSVIPVEFRPR